MCFKKFWDWLTGKSSTTAPPSPPPPVNVGPDGNMLIVVINKSSIISNDEVNLMTQGVAKQAREHAAPAWDIKPPRVEYRGAEVDAEPGAFKVLIFDDADIAGALGYHSDGPDGLPYGRVFVKVTQKHGLSVSSVLSHEVLEIMMDPQANYWADNWNDGLTYALEVADPVESDYYKVDVDGQEVEVSNFALPAWFDPLPPAGSKFDWLGKLSKPFTMTKGGYVIIRDQSEDRAVFGASYPEWKKELKLKSPSRTKRRHDKTSKKG
jgi:hypothetical protein